MYDRLYNRETKASSNGKRTLRSSNDGELDKANPKVLESSLFPSDVNDIREVAE